MTIQRRMTTGRKARVVKRADSTPVIEGYAAVFYDGTEATEYRMWPDMIERVMPTAFDRAIKEDDVRGLENHDPTRLLGRTKAGTMRLSVDDVGLKYEIDVPDTQVGRDAVTSIERGDMDGSSFAFSTDAVEWRDEKQPDGRVITYRELTAVTLYDTGPVTFPAYESTTAGVRAIGDVSAVVAERNEWRERRVDAAKAAMVRAQAVEAMARL